MFDQFFADIKNLWIGTSAEKIELDEFIRSETKHTRVRHDEDIREQIRVH